MDNYIFLSRSPPYPDPEIARAMDPSENRDAVLYEALHFRVVTQAGVVTCGRGGCAVTENHRQGGTYAWYVDGIIGIIREGSSFEVTQRPHYARTIMRVSFHAVTCSRSSRVFFLFLLLDREAQRRYRSKSCRGGRSNRVALFFPVSPHAIDHLRHESRLNL